MLTSPAATTGARESSPRVWWQPLLACGAAVLAALALYTRFGLNGLLSRDEAIYVYGGIQLAQHGTPPYSSIFDPKGPGATFVNAAGALVARLFGADPLPVIRVEFLLISLLTVVAVYLLVVRLWGSHLGGFVAGVVFASFYAFAVDALAGPNAKTPGVLLLVLAMWFAAGRRWAWSGVVGSLAFLVWQPFFIYPLVTLVAALCIGDSRAGDTQERGWHGPQWRAFGRAVVAVVAPVAVVAVYFAAAGAFGRFIESAFVFPLTGIKRTPSTFTSHVHLIGSVVERFAGPLAWIGGLLLLGLLVAAIVTRRRAGAGWLGDPLVHIVGVTGVLAAAYALYDFQWYPDLLPLLPYPAIGFGGAVGVLVPRLRGIGFKALVAAAVAAGIALTGFQWVSFGGTHAEIGQLVAQRRVACEVNAIAGPAPGAVYSLGNPEPLVLTGRTNPDRFIYLDSGVAAWKVRHLAGGVAAWAAQIRRDDPRVIIEDGWIIHNPLRRGLLHRLRGKGYVSRHVGPLHVFVPPRTVTFARQHDLHLTVQATNPKSWVCIPTG